MARQNNKASNKEKRQQYACKYMHQVRRSEMDREIRSYNTTSQLMYARELGKRLHIIAVKQNVYQGQAEQSTQHTGMQIVLIDFEFLIK